MTRVARDVSIHLFRRAPAGPSYLMLRRIPDRGGSWQAESGAPLPGETDQEDALREVRAETGIDVGANLFPLGVRYAYALRPDQTARWADLYGPDVASIPVVAFAAEAPATGEPVLDFDEHDALAWCTYEEAYALLDWPIEPDALAGRREALRVLEAHVRMLAPEPLEGARQASRGNRPASSEAACRGGRGRAS